MKGRIKSAFLFVSKTRFNISSSATMVFPALVGAEYTKLPARNISTPYNGIYREAPPKRGTYSRPQVYERIGISLIEVP